MTSRIELRHPHPSIHVEAIVLKSLISIVLAATVLGGCGPATRVEQGMPAGAAIFDQTDPTCLPNPDGTSFRCTLARPPAGEAGTFLGYKEVLAIDGVAAGGCIGIDFAGRTWNCYLGQAAVDHEIISQDFLGEPVLGPRPRLIVYCAERLAGPPSRSAAPYSWES